ncbi:unnamed protein product, partial [marine sediment metagenome]
KIGSDVPAPSKDPQAGEWRNVEMEYIQVIDYGPLAKDLTGWTIRDDSGVKFTFPQHQISLKEEGVVKKSFTVLTMIFAARSKGKPKIPVDIAGRAMEHILFS